MDLPHGNQHMYHLAQAQRPLYPQRTDRLDDILFEPADTSDNASALEEYRELYRLISRLGDIDKALITLWLEEKPYEEIAHITGLSPASVAVRLHRAILQMQPRGERSRSCSMRL